MNATLCTLASFICAVPLGALLALSGCALLGPQRMIEDIGEEQYLTDTRAVRRYVQRHVEFTVRQTGRESFQAQFVNRGRDTVPLLCGGVLWTWQSTDGAWGPIGWAESGPSTVDVRPAVRLLEPNQTNTSATGHSLICNGTREGSWTALTSGMVIRAYYLSPSGYVIKRSAPVHFNPEVDKRPPPHRDGEKLNRILHRTEWP
jgi:hypothetical protein